MLCIRKISLVGAVLLAACFTEQFGATRAQLTAKLGVPASSVGDTLRNRFDSTVVDSIVTLKYRTLQVTFFVGRSLTEFPTNIAVTDSSVRLPLAVGIGANRAQLEHAFGTPSYESLRADSLLIQFDVPDDTSSALVFYLVGAVVRKVAWAYGVD